MLVVLSYRIIHSPRLSPKGKPRLFLNLQQKEYTMPANTQASAFPLATFSRRDMLKFSVAALATGALAHSALFPASAKATENTDQSVLIAYYSRTGNTRNVAQHIHSRVGGTVFELHTTHSYPEEYRTTTVQAKQEQESNFRPTLTATVENMDTYHTVFIGYPNWWGTFPMALFTFLESYNFAGKTLVPFCTHEGSGLGRGPADIARLCPQAKVLPGFDVRGGSAATAQTNIDAWLKEIGLA